jgi:hypothetical protein
MKVTTLLCMTLLLCPVAVPAQQPSQGKDNELSHKDMAITGCLTKNSLKESKTRTLRRLLADDAVSPFD